MTVRVLGRRHKVHVLILLAFRGKAPYGYEVDHRDGNRANNTLANLRYLPHAEKIRRTHRGTKAMVLLPDEALVTVGEAAGELGISRQSIHYLLRAREIKHWRAGIATVLRARDLKRLRRR